MPPFYISLTSAITACLLVCLPGCLAPAQFPKPYAYDEHASDCDASSVVRWRMTAAIWKEKQVERSFATQKELPIQAGDLVMGAEQGVECVYSAPVCMTFNEHIWTSFRKVRCSLDHFRTFANAEASIFFAPPTVHEPSKDRVAEQPGYLSIVLDPPARRDLFIILYGEDKRLPPDPQKQGPGVAK